MVLESALVSFFNKWFTSASYLRFLQLCSRAEIGSTLYINYTSHTQKKTKTQRLSITEEGRKEENVTDRYRQKVNVRYNKKQRQKENSATYR